MYWFCNNFEVFIYIYIYIYIYIGRGGFEWQSGGGVGVVQQEAALPMIFYIVL